MSESEKSRSFSEQSKSGSSQNSDSEIDSEEQDDVVFQEPLQNITQQESGLKMKIDTSGKKSIVDEEGEGYSPMKKIQDYKEIDQQEYYEQMEEECLQYVRDHKKMWIDPDFPPNNSILYKNMHDIPHWSQEIKTIKWYRPHEITKDPRFMDDKQDWDVKQGAFGESWFIGALVIVNSQGDYVEKLIVDSSHFDKGFVAFQFFKNGTWRIVVVDTFLPYDPDTKMICFGMNLNQNEFWISLCEKAYAKLHGSYEAAMEGSLVEGLTDLTGGVSEKLNLSDLTPQQKSDNGSLWIQMKQYFNQKFHLGCVNYVEEKSTKNAETGPHGILENHQYGILDMRDFQNEQLKLIKIRNPWGQDGGWNGPFSDESEEWDKNKALRVEIMQSQKGKKQESGTWWMSFQDFCAHFNELLICKVFNENWQQYSIMGRWQGKTAGGVFPAKIELKDLLEIGTDTQNLAMSLKSNLQKGGVIPEYYQADSDEKWFNNPQYLIRIEKDTKLYISLMQEDEKVSRVNYIKCNFMVIDNKNKRHRIWERPDTKEIINEAHLNKTIEEIIPQREVVQQVTLKKQEGKSHGYFIIIPNAITDNKKEEQRQFWLRIFASEKVDVVELPETIDTQVEGGWLEESSGGKRRIKSKDNPNWCKNPQYFLNLKKATHLKIILKKIGQVRKTRGIKIGMTIMRFLQSNQQKSEDLQMKNNNNNQIKMFKKEDEEEENKQQQQQQQQQKVKSNKKVSQGLEKLIQSTKLQLEAPQMPILERKLQIFTKEWFKETVYHSDELSCLYFFLNPTDGPFIIVPSMDQEDKGANFKLQIYSDNEIELQKLDELKNSVHIGNWVKDLTDGGCHLYEEPYETVQQMKTWSSNPKFVLNFQENKMPSYLKITLSIADKNWKAQTKNVVGGMIGIYLLRVSQDGKFSKDNAVRLPNFIPLMTIQEEYTAADLTQTNYFIMPTTYENKITGQFILSVHSDQEFTFQPLK